MAALLMSSEIFEAANSLEMMIEAPVDKAILLAAYHLQGLLQRLEPRLCRVGFSNNVLGWMVWW
jgi:hypothetical protein